MVNEAASATGRLRRPQQSKADQSTDHLYPFEQVDFSEDDVKGRYESVVGPLSLFNSMGKEDGKQDKMELERPITPIDDEIKATPTTMQKLAKLVRRRITPKAQKEHISVEGQKDLASVIMGELNGIWSDMRLQVEDPFMSPEENRELQRRICVHVVTVCEQLFLHYTDKAAILNKRGVFSGPANMSRLKAQLALDANKFLNVLTIRRYIVGDMRGGEGGDSLDDLPSFRKKPGVPPAPTTKLSYKGFLEVSRPKSKTKKFLQSTAEQEMKKLVDKMPTLDATKLVPLIQEMPERTPSQISASTGLDFLSESSEGEEIAAQQKVRQQLLEIPRPSTDELINKKVREHRSSSKPDILLGEDLLEEMGISVDRRSVMSLNDIEEEEGVTAERTEEVHEDTRPKPGTREYAAEDLRKLVSNPDDGAAKEDEEDLPPLLQALTSGVKQDGKKAWIEGQLRDLEAREKARRIEESIEIREPTHPQPATVTNKMPNKLVVRTSDIRVSERVCLSSITLKKNATVYNDLIDEISPATVKQLDSNLFLGNEINEVYKEIMKTVPSDHLDLENDVLTEPTADTVNLSAALASSTLNRKREDRVINPELHKSTGPPWGRMELEQWIKTPVSPPKDFRGRPIIQPMSPRGRGDEWHDLLGSKAEQYMPEEQMPPKKEKNAMADYLARTYASWLTWWKSTVNSDDYMKYLSTQESDYMGVIFHFYNSDDEEDEEDIRSPTKSTRKTVKQMEEEKMQKLNEIRAQKTEYQEGFWNVNSVMLGGLGRDPNIEDDETELLSRAPTDSDAESKITRSRSMLVSRKSSRQQGSEHSPRNKNRDGAASRYTQQTTDLTDNGKEKKVEVTVSNTPQDRLEKVWSQLMMPDGQKLDMAIKYSSDTWHQKLDYAIEDWEDAAEMITEREENMAKLEKFERLASDPNRFFEKGQRGSSVARLHEARIRSSYYRKIEDIDVELKKKLEFIKKEYSDEVTFQGRPYSDKMHWDRTEMLYWLQEERKQQAIDYEAKMRNLPQLPIHMARLDPISPSV